MQKEALIVIALIVGSLVLFQSHLQQSLSITGRQVSECYDPCLNDPNLVNLGKLGYFYFENGKPPDPTTTPATAKPAQGRGPGTNSWNVYDGVVDLTPSDTFLTQPPSPPPKPTPSIPVRVTPCTTTYPCYGYCTISKLHSSSPEEFPRWTPFIALPCASRLK